VIANRIFSGVTCNAWVASHLLGGNDGILEIEPKAGWMGKNGSVSSQWQNAMIV
jgi:hypothetical protein